MQSSPSDTARGNSDQISRLRDLARRLVADAADLTDHDLRRKMMKAAAELIETASTLEGSADLASQSAD